MSAAGAVPPHTEAAARATPTLSPRAELLAVLALTALAFALRLPLMDQSLTLDEPHSWVMAKGSLGDVFRELRGGYEIHPPLYFVLAWAAGKVGDPTVWVRVPSLVLGTASVPLTYLLGRRAVGRGAAGVGAALVALSPFAVRYASDARPYATLMFFALLSTWALLVAMDTGRARWWALYAAAVCAVAYTHYFGAFVVIAQAVWVLAFVKEQRRSALLSYAAAAVGYLPWVPSLLEQPHKTSDFAGGVTLTAGFAGDELLLFLPGNGFNRVEDLLGTLPVVALGVVLAVLLVLALREARRRGARIGRPPDAVALLIFVAIATPAGLLAFSIFGDNVWLSRYLGTSLPALALLLGALVTRVPRGAAVAALAVTFLVLGAGTVRSYETRFARGGYKEAARYLEDSVGPNDVVLEFQTAAKARNRLSISPIDVNFTRDMPVISGPVSSAQRLFREAPTEAGVFVAGIDYGAFLQLPRPAPEIGLCAVRRRAFNGFIAVYEYQQAVARKGREGIGQARELGGAGGGVLRLASGDRLPLAEGNVRGSLDLAQPKKDSVEVTAWALDGSANPAGCVLVYEGERLVGFALPSLLRPDLREIYGRRAEGAGFKLRTDRPADPDRLRVIAIADGRASELSRPP